MERTIEDPLSLRLFANSPALESNSVLELEIEKWGGSNLEISESSKSKNPMIKIGDILFKPKETLSVSWLHPNLRKSNGDTKLHS